MDVPKLLLEAGPPGEWSGGVAGALGPEKRRALLQAWRSMSAEERNTVLAKFREHHEKSAASNTPPKHEKATYPKGVGLSAVRGALAGMAGGAAAAPLMQGGRITSLKQLGKASIGQAGQGAVAGAVLGTIFDAGKLQGRVEQLRAQGSRRRLHPVDAAVAKTTQKVLGDSILHTVGRGAALGAVGGGGYSMYHGHGDAKTRALLALQGAGLGALKGSLTGAGLGAIRDIGRGSGKREEEIAHLQRKHGSAVDKVAEVYSVGSLRRGDTGVWTPAKIHRIADHCGVKWDNDPAFMDNCEKRTGKRHLDQMTPAQLGAVADALQTNAARRKWLQEHPEKTAATPESKERQEARKRVQAHFRADGQAKWDDFIDNAKRKSFVTAVQADNRSDKKLERHVDQMNRLLTGTAVGTVQGRGGKYTITRLRGSTALGCTCPDWRYKQSVSPAGDQDCKHIREWRARHPAAKTAELVPQYRAKHADDAAERSKARYELAGLGLLAVPAVAHGLTHVPVAGVQNAVKPVSNFLKSHHELPEHALEAIGLGVLAKPSVQELLHHRKQPGTATG